MILISRDLSKLEGYINHIGPLIDLQHKTDRLLVHSGPRGADERAQLHPGSRKKNVFQCSLF